MAELKIAFTSCMSRTVFDQQPVWDQIAERKPDRLLLLGDSIYIDMPPYPVGITSPDQFAPNDYLVHVLGRWRNLLDQPQFRALVSKVATDAIWDDHDFLWDSSYGEGAARMKRHEDCVGFSRALFNVFCETLEKKLAPGSFPDVPNDWRLNQLTAKPPGYRLRKLAPDILLHLTDGRSWRLKRELLGKAQRAQIEAAMASAPQAVHLLASGSVVANDGSSWQGFDDHPWLLDLARRYKILVLSGDIHDNRFETHALGGGRFLHDATASGAAVFTMVTRVCSGQNYGLLTIGDEALRLDFSSFGKPTPGLPSRRIDRRTWQSEVVAA